MPNTPDTLIRVFVVVVVVVVVVVLNYLFGDIITETLPFFSHSYENWDHKFVDLGIILGIFRGQKLEQC